VVTDGEVGFDFGRAFVFGPFLSSAHADHVLTFGQPTGEFPSQAAFFPSPLYAGTEFRDG
jgi:hypothetical protein